MMERKFEWDRLYEPTFLDIIFLKSGEAYKRLAWLNGNIDFEENRLKNLLTSRNKYHLEFLIKQLHSIKGKFTKTLIAIIQGFLREDIPLDVKSEDICKYLLYQY